MLIDPPVSYPHRGRREITGLELRLVSKTFSLNFHRRSSSRLFSLLWNISMEQRPENSSAPLLFGVQTNHRGIGFLRLAARKKSVVTPRAVDGSFLKGRLFFRDLRCTLNSRKCIHGDDNNGECWHDFSTTSKEDQRFPRASSPTFGIRPGNLAARKRDGRTADRKQTQGDKFGRSSTSIEHFISYVRKFRRGPPGEKLDCFPAHVPRRN